jgi:putative copper resistance protein D
MRGLYLVNVTVHVFAAMLWLGGMFFLAVVGAPVLRQVEPPALRARLFEAIGRRFRAAGWAAIGVLVVTGAQNLAFAGVFRAGRWRDAAFWDTPYGHALAWKLAAVAAMLVCSAAHDFWLGPRAGRLVPGSPAAIAARGRSAMLARVNAGFGAVVVIAAVRLARGG